MSFHDLFKKDAPKSEAVYRRLAHRWSAYVGKRVRGLPPGQEGMFARKTWSGIRSVWAELLIKGSVDSLLHAPSFYNAIAGFNGEKTLKMVVGFWKDFREVERELIAEIILTQDVKP